MCLRLASHGTHVASIAAGNHKSSGNEELDGVAPGAKIVSLTIGDGRLGSVFTFTTKQNILYSNYNAFIIQFNGNGNSNCESLDENYGIVQCGKTRSSNQHELRRIYSLVKLRVSFGKLFYFLFYLIIRV